MSTDKKTVHYNLFNASKPMVQHLIKLIEFPEARAKNHWAKEVHAFLNDVPRLKHTKKLPSAKFIYSEISCYNDVLEGIIRFALDTEPDEHFANAPPEECIPILEDYEMWLAQKLSSEGYVTWSEVNQKLEDIGLL